MIMLNDKGLAIAESHRPDRNVSSALNRFIHHDGSRGQNQG